MIKVSAAAVLSSLLFVSVALASSKTYQVTGPVVAVNPESVVVKKGKDNWEIKTTPDTKIDGQLKPGQKVTITYTMAASTIEPKGPAPKSKTK